MTTSGFHWSLSNGSMEVKVKLVSEPEQDLEGFFGSVVTVEKENIETLSQLLDVFLTFCHASGFPYVEFIEATTTDKTVVSSEEGPLSQWK